MAQELRSHAIPHRPWHRHDDPRLSLERYRPGLGILRRKGREDGTVAVRGAKTAGAGIALNQYWKELQKTTDSCGLQDSRLVQQFAAGEALEGQHRYIIHYIGFSPQNQVR